MLSIRIQRADISIEREIHRIQDKKMNSGAVVTFTGVMRREKGLNALVYECYNKMANMELKRLAVTAKKRFKVNDISIIHRTGVIKSGGMVILIAVGALRRKEAFEACIWLIDNIKKTVPIWKKELRVGCRKRSVCGYTRKGV
jgi:molybdopterin synthase catalytic subunit